MISLKTVKEKSKRTNQAIIEKSYYFSSRFSIYFSWMFINLNLSADHVTILFFLTGILSSLFYLGTNPMFSIYGYIFYRLHIIFDMSDGDVARFRDEKSIRGGYWDSMAHSIIYPILVFNLSISLWLIYSDVYFIILGGYFSIITLLTLSVKNNYFKAILYYDHNMLNIFKEKSRQIDSNSLYFKIFNIVSLLLSLEGFLPLYIISCFVQNKLFSIILIVAYMVIFSIIIGIKFISFSYRGYYITRS